MYSNEVTKMFNSVLETIMVSSTNLSFIKDCNLTYVCSSRAFANMVGLEDEKDIVGKTDYDLFDEELANLYREDDRRLMEGKEAIVDYIESLPAHNGNERYSNTSKYLLRDSCGNVIGLFGMGKDITHVRETYSKLKFLTDNIPGGITMYEVKSDKVKTIYASDRIYDVTGYSEKEYKEYAGSDILKIVYEDDKQLVRYNIENILKNGRPIEFIYRIIRKDLKIRWIRLRGVLSERKLDSIIINAIVFDVTEQKNAELEREAGKKAMELASNAGDILFWRYDIDNKIIYNNTYVEQSSIIDKIEQQNVPESMIESGMIVEEDIEEFRAMYQRLFDGCTKSECTVRVKRNGTDKLEWRRVVYNRLDGEFFPRNEAVGFSINVDMEQEHRLRYEYENNLRHEMIKDALLYYQVNLSTKYIEEYHTKYNDIKGMESNVDINEDLQSSILDNVADEDKERVKNTIFNDALMKAYKRGEKYVSIIYRRKILNQGHRWVVAEASILDKAKTGDIVAFIHCRSIDEDIKNQLAIKTIMDEEIQSAIVLNIPSKRARYTQIVNDKHNNICSSNFDYSKKKEDILNEVYNDDINECKEFFDLDKMMHRLSKKKVINITYRMNRNNCIIRKKARAFYLDDTCEDIVLIIRDITDIYEEEQKQKAILEEAIKNANAANMAKSDFLSRMSHDMRTPLNAVLSFSNPVMTDDIDEKELREYLKKIHMSGEYLLGIINDILDMSKIEQNKIELNREIYSLGEFIATIENVIEESCKDKNIEFTITTDATRIDSIKVDKVRFNQIFVNLLSNAVKFTPDGGKVELIIEHLKDVGISRKKFTVRDNGIGMGEDFIPHAFESFNQEYRKNESQNGQGTGLGLAIVKELVELMNGSIEVNSRLGEGTTFVVILPLEVINQDQLLKDISVSNKKDIEGMHILLVEDNPINMQIAIALLKKQGCIIETAVNGKEAVNKFKESDMQYYDAVLMDIRMPVMNGLEAAAAIRKLDRADAKKTPIIAMTADAFSKDEKIAHDAGMNAHIPKPIEPQFMYDMLTDIYNGINKK